MTGLGWFVASVVLSVANALQALSDILPKARRGVLLDDGRLRAVPSGWGLPTGWVQWVHRWPWAVAVPAAPPTATRLARAGWLTDVSEPVARRWLGRFAALCATAGALLGGLLSLLVEAPPVMWPVVLGAGYLGGRRMAFKMLDRAGDRRAQMVLAGLPQWLEDVALAAQGGLSLRQAIEVANGVGEGPLVAETRRAMINVRAGQPLRDALLQVTQRFPEAELAVSIRTLLEVEARGMPLAETVEEQVQLLRSLASRQRQRRIEALPVWLSVITIGLLLPPVLIVTVLPNVMQFLRLYQ